MNIYKFKNIDEEIIVKIELSDRVKKNIRNKEQTIKFEISLIEKLRKAYSYGILNRYVLTNKELIKWLNESMLGGTIVQATEEDIEKAERSLEIDLSLQGDLAFYKGRNDNFYNQLENITAFGIDSLNRIIFQSKISLNRSLIIGGAILLGVIGTFLFKLQTIGFLGAIIAAVTIVDMKAKDKRRIKRFVKFNQNRINFSKKIYKEKTNLEGKDFKYTTEKGKCYIREVI